MGDEDRRHVFWQEDFVELNGLSPTTRAIPVNYPLARC
jgi:hypothetical protein